MEPVRQDAILDWVGEASLEAGYPFARDGDITGARLEGTLLRARCQGSAAVPYRVWARIAGGAVAEAGCSCRVGDLGRCKHVAALLLTWLERPEAVGQTEEPAARLARFTKDQLVALVLRMLEADPELESLLDPPVPGSKTSAPAVSPEGFRKQAEQAFLNADGGWSAAYRVATDLGVLVGVGEDFLRKGQYAAAGAVFTGVMEAIAEHYGTLRDEEGVIAEELSGCLRGLEAVLPHLVGEGRTRALRGLADVLLLGLQWDGVGPSDAFRAELPRLTTPEERAQIAARLEAARPRHSGDPGRAALGRLLMDLRKDALDDEAYLAHCREWGLSTALIERLLNLGRLPEAVEAAAALPDHSLLWAATLLEGRGHQEAAEELVARRAPRSAHEALSGWLQERRARAGDHAGALRHARRRFDLGFPTLAGYREIRELARKAGEWERARPELLRNLEGRDPALLTGIYLEEGELDAALGVVRRLLGRGGATQWGAQASGPPPAVLATAAAAEGPCPAAARELYQQLAELAIAARGRGKYASACAYLVKVRALYQREGREEEWTAYRTRLMHEHRTLQALRKEMDAAGLL